MFSGLLIQKYEIYKFGVGIGNKIAMQHQIKPYFME
jgi:hypothetical protein